MKYRYGSHMVYQIEYHFVWVTKYRRTIFNDTKSTIQFGSWGWHRLMHCARVISDSAKNMTVTFYDFRI